MTTSVPFSSREYQNLFKPMFSLPLFVWVFILFCFILLGVFVPLLLGALNPHTICLLTNPAPFPTPKKAGPAKACPGCLPPLGSTSIPPVSALPLCPRQAAEQWILSKWWCCPVSTFWANPSYAWHPGVSISQTSVTFESSRPTSSSIWRREGRTQGCSSYYQWAHPFQRGNKKTKFQSMNQEAWTHEKAHIPQLPNPASWPFWKKN